MWAGRDLNPSSQGTGTSTCLRQHVSRQSGENANLKRLAPTACGSKEVKGDHGLRRIHTLDVRRPRRSMNAISTQPSLRWKYGEERCGRVVRKNARRIPLNAGKPRLEPRYTRYWDQHVLAAACSQIVWQKCVLLLFLSYRMQEQGGEEGLEPHTDECNLNANFRHRYGKERCGRVVLENAHRRMRQAKT